MLPSLLQVGRGRDCDEGIRSYSSDRLPQPSHQRRQPRDPERLPLLRQGVGIGHRIFGVTRWNGLTNRWSELRPNRLAKLANGQTAVIEARARVAHVVEMDAVDLITRDDIADDAVNVVGGGRSDR